MILVLRLKALSALTLAASCMAGALAPVDVNADQRKPPEPTLMRQQQVRALP